MITRVWRGWAAGSLEADAYQELLSSEILPGLRSLPGFGGATVLRRQRAGEVEFMVETRFESLEAVTAFAGPDAERAVIEPRARALLSRVEARALLYETVAEIPAAG